MQHNLAKSETEQERSTKANAISREQKSQFILLECIGDMSVTSDRKEMSNVKCQTHRQVMISDKDRSVFRLKQSDFVALLFENTLHSRICKVKNLY